MNKPGSDDRTTEYMKRFQSALEQRGCRDTMNDKYLNHYTSKIHANALPVKIALMRSPPNICVPIRRIPSLTPKSVVDVSDRNLLCMATRGNEVVVGGADHALRVFRVSQTSNPRLSRQLYSKRCGHSDWVTTVDFMDDGRVISGGMDSKVCIWRGVQSKDLTEHAGSVSRVRAVGNKAIVSSSYDRSVKIWCATSGTLLSSLHGHTGAVLDFVFLEPHCIATASRDATTRIWDVSKGKLRTTFSGHEGHVNAILSSSDILFTGAQDGVVNGWDYRTSKSVFRCTPFPRGTSITLMARSTDGKRLHVVGSNTGVSTISCDSLRESIAWSGDHETFIYSIYPLPSGEVLTGSGDGTVVLRGSNGELKTKAKVSDNAIRAIVFTDTGDSLLATDDGTLITVLT